MSNRSALTSTRQTITALEASLGRIEQDVSSTAAALRIGQAQAHLRAAADAISDALDHPTDPILDLTKGVIEPGGALCR